MRHFNDNADHDGHVATDLVLQVLAIVVQRDVGLQQGDDKMDTSNWRQDWAKQVFEFSVASQGVVESYTITPQQIAALATASRAPGCDRTVRTLVDVVGQWLEHTKTGQQPQPLCLTCETRFSRHITPELFIVSLPFGKPVGGMVSGVCEHCIDDPEIGDKLRELMRRIWPNLHDVDVMRMQ
jgi:hypothetical protein